MKIYEFEFEHKTEWIVAENKIAAKALVVQLDPKYQDYIHAGEVSVRELQGYELDRIFVPDSRTGESVVLRDVLARKEMEREEMPFYLGGEYNTF